MGRDRLLFPARIRSILINMVGYLCKLAALLVGSARYHPERTDRDKWSS